MDKTPAFACKDKEAKKKEKKLSTKEATTNTCIEQEVYTSSRGCCHVQQTKRIHIITA